MKKPVYKSAYSKWDAAEPRATAYEKVKSGEWSLERFEDWVSQVEIEEYRNATQNESL